MSVTVEELDDQQWEQVRDEVARRWLGLSAADFVERFNAGAYAEVEPEELMSVLAFFPELD